MNSTTKDSFSICFFPTEVLTLIFAYLHPKSLLVCRAVCVRWQLIVDNYNKNEFAWRKHCRRDYADICETAYIKSIPVLSWYHLYRSLALWSKIPHALETRKEFATLNSSHEIIKDFQVLRNGVIGVHTKDAIVYYDINTLQRSQRPTINGAYLKYRENDNMVLVLNQQKQLSVVRNMNMASRFQITNTFNNVDVFLLLKNAIYYVTVDDELYLCGINNNQLTTTMLRQMPYNVKSLGYQNGYLYILTIQYLVYILDGVELKQVDACAKFESISENLNYFNLFDQAEWKIFYQWMCFLQQLTDGVSHLNIVTIYNHGPVMFVGYYFGVLRIYYSLFTNESYDLFKSKPLMEYNFLEKHHHPLTACPILHIDVVESEGSHTILVAMPKKIVSINLTHSL